jgi:hypothetical protein
MDNCLNDEGYAHLTINCTTSFVDDTTDVWTNNAESLLTSYISASHGRYQA